MVCNQPRMRPHRPPDLLPRNPCEASAGPLHVAVCENLPGTMCTRIVPSQIYWSMPVVRAHLLQANGAKKASGYIVVGGIRCRYFPDNPWSMVRLETSARHLACRYYWKSCNVLLCYLLEAGEIKSDVNARVSSEGQKQELSLCFMFLNYSWLKQRISLAL